MGKEEMDVETDIVTKSKSGLAWVSFNWNEPGALRVLHT